MDTNKPRAEHIAGCIEAIRHLAETVEPLAERIEALSGLEIDDDTRATIQARLDEYRANIAECRATIDEIAQKDRVTGAVLSSGLAEIERKTQRLALPPRSQDVPDPIEQARQVIDDAMADTMRSIDQIMTGILPTFFESMQREYRDRDDIENDTQLIGLNIHLPKQIENDPNGVAVGVEVIHLASVDNTQIDELLESEKMAHELADHFSGHAIALVQHGKARPVENADDEAAALDAFMVTVIHPFGMDTHIQTRPLGATEWQSDDDSAATLDIRTETDRDKVARGEFGKMPASLAYFYAHYLQASGEKRRNN